MKHILKISLFVWVVYLNRVPSSFAQGVPAFATTAKDAAHWREFDHLWEQRFERDVSTELLPFVDNSDSDMAQRAVRALGRLERPSSLLELEKRKRVQEDLKTKSAFATGSNRLSFATAIARIQSRTLHGREKIEFVLARMPMPWTWAQALEWSRKVAEPKNYLTNSPAATQIREIVDMLYTMSKKGEDIEPLRKQFVFTKPQDVQLDGAKLSRIEEAKHLLDYSQTIDLVDEDDEYVCESHLLSLGQPARIALKKQMLLLLQLKPPFKNRFPATCMLRAAAMTNDQTFLPIIERFDRELSYVPYMSHYTSQSRMRLVSQTGYSYAPQ